VARLTKLGDDLVATAAHYDHVILDLGAGLERTVRELTRLAACCVVVTTDEPTSLTDAYAFVKVAHLDRTEADMRIVVNIAYSVREGERTYGALLRACESFLKISPPLLGVIGRDPKVREAIRSQTSLLTRFPNCMASEDVEAVAANLTALPFRTEAVQLP
jgi:flagellar biosynthesis protein FlhG